MLISNVEGVENVIVFFLTQFDKYSKIGSCDESIGGASHILSMGGHIRRSGPDELCEPAHHT